MNNLNTIPDLMNYKLVDMALITKFTGLTDKWFYKLISEGKFPKPIKMERIKGFIMLMLSVAYSPILILSSHKDNQSESYLILFTCL
ncbi:hypothetical protein SOASR029_00040 [Budvicia aquatica]|nr:hypothetical protein SOASR029_00040 [Budvicia aquatica]